MASAPRPQAVVSGDLTSDERWQLAQRIAASPAFHKSARLRDLLLHIAERAIHGHADELTEAQIGEALFHKPHGYSPLEDSSVRVHARQLRLKLHEYFNSEGRDEPLILEIPKGSYVPAFRSAVVAPVAREPEPVRQVHKRFEWGWLAAGILAAVCVTLLFRGHARPPATPAWPFSAIFDASQPTTIVVADGNYGMERLLTGQHGSLDQYLRRELSRDPAIDKVGQLNPAFRNYVVQSTLTSFADISDAAVLIKMAGPLNEHTTVRFPRDLRIRDLDHGNFVFIGSPGSNPWTALFQDRTNFREAEGEVGKSEKTFVNTKPMPGEQAVYQGLQSTGTMGEDYATITLLPNASHDGNVLILQGLQQEGTEAAGSFLANEHNRAQLMKALGVTAANQKVWFEALIRSRTVSGAPSETSLVALRKIR